MNIVNYDTWTWQYKGGWNAWAIFGRMDGHSRLWVWINDQNANCGVTDY